MTTELLQGALVVGDVLDLASRRYRDRIAVQDATGSLTFAQLGDRARRLADGLLRTGLQPGDRVLEALPNSCDLIVSEFALALAGLIRVPLNPRLGPREWRAISDDSSARGLIADGHLQGADGSPITEHVTREITLRADEGALAELIATGSAPTLLPRLNQDDVVGLAYSSGTTGLPKGALRTHSMRLASMRAMIRDVVSPTGAAETYLHAGPAIHTSGLFILPMLALGVRQVMVQHPSPEAITKIVGAEGITHLALVPSVIDALTHLPETERKMFARVRMLAYAGAPMPPVQIRRAAEMLTDRLVQYYGLVEAIPPLAVLSIEDHARGLHDEPRLLTSAGFIGRDVRLEVVGDANPGEIAVSGPMVTAGYWGAEDRTDLGKAFSDGWLLTGDVGTVSNGYLFLTDRKNNMMISGGYNVYPAEIESAVESSPGLRSAVVVGVPDERWGQRITLAYTTTSGDDLSAEQREALRTRVASLTPHKRPKTWHFCTQFPLGATGKIDRRAVAAQLIAAEHPLSGASHERCQTK